MMIEEYFLMTDYALVSFNNTDSTNKAVNTAHGVSAASSKTNASNLPNINSLRDGLEVADGNVNHENQKISTKDRKESRNIETTKRTVPVHKTTSNVLVSQCDGLGYDWSDQAKDGPTNFALMAYTSSCSLSSDSEVSSCSKACLKSYETLKEHYDNLTKDFNKSQLNLGAYKAGLESVEARLEVYKKNEAIFKEEIKILKLDVMFKDKAIIELRQKFEKAEKERDDLKHTLEKFKGSSKNLSTLLDSQQCDKSKTGLGENENEIKTETNQIGPSFAKIVGGYVAFGGDPKGGKIIGKGKIHIGKLDFKDVYFVKELKFNLFSISHMCDKKNIVLFKDTKCVVLSPNFKLLDESQVLLRVPRKNNMYSVDLRNVAPSGCLTCLFVKATIDESNLWHRRLRHINFKTMNKLLKGNLVRGLPLKIFANDHTCVACQKGKQHKASYKTKNVRREFSVARTLQQNGVAERKNNTLIKAARTILADSKLPTTFWAEAVNTACYVQNRVLVIKPHNKTPYELFLVENMP
nr:ribonuclease H-like domain-containing protein [Tanacetum cinerariifolium]